MASPWFPCPKCGSEHAWHEIRGADTWLHCLCGYLKVVETRLQVMAVAGVVKAEKLPRKFSMLWDCLMMVAGLEFASSQEITDRLNIVRQRQKIPMLTLDDVSTQLSVLYRPKGLVFPSEVRKGRGNGGSVWELTETAKVLINEEE